MPHILFDTSIYISAIRKGHASVLALRNVGHDSPLWLSAVVLEELYAGASGPHIQSIAQFQKDFERARRIVLPILTDWVQAGGVLSRLAEKYGYEQIGRGRLTNDALIAASARRLGIEVLTANERDFRKLAEFRSFRYRVITI